MEIDTSALDDFARELDAKAIVLAEQVRPVVNKGALNVKNQMQADMRRSRHFKAARWITYDIETGAEGITAEIGPVKAGAGNLAHIAYFGGRNGGGGTVRDPEEAMKEEEPRFMSALDDIVAKVWK